MTVGQAACQLLCRYTQSPLAASCLLLNRTDCYVCLYQKKLWLFMFEMHLISGITDGWQGCEPPSSAKLNVTSRPLPGLYIDIYYSFGFSRLLYFFVFFGVFSGDFGFSYGLSILDFLLFLNYFLSVSRWAPFS